MIIKGNIERERERERERKRILRRGWRIIANITLIYLNHAVDVFGGVTKIEKYRKKQFFIVNWKDLISALTKL